MNNLQRMILVTLWCVSLFWLPMIASAAFLVSNPMAGVQVYDVDVDGTITPDFPAEADGSIRYDVSALPPGDHTFKLRPKGLGGWPADWSDPFDASKPGATGNLGMKIVE